MFNGGNDCLANLHHWAAARSLKALRKVTLANVLAGDTCAPISLAEFEAYLVFREHSPENLQFVVWYQDYRKRFFELPPEKQALSPGRSSFTFAAPSAAATETRDARSRQTTNDSDSTFVTPPSSPVPLTPISPVSVAQVPLLQHEDASMTQETFTQRIGEVTIDTYVDVSDARPFHKECLRSIATFLKPGAPKELSLDAKVRDTVIRDASRSSHPNVFHPVYEEAYHMLESSSLPRFLALSTANINLPKQLYWYMLGSIDLSIGVIIALTLIFTLPTSPEANRAWRLFSLPFVFIGTAQIYSAWRGFCSEVWRRGKMQVRAWELQEIDEDTKAFIRQVLQESFPPASENEKRTSIGLLCNLPDGTFPDKHGYGKPIFSRNDDQPSELIPRDHSPKTDTPARVGFVRPPIFGPETVVQDPHIKAVHQQVMNDIYIFGVLCGLIFSAIVLSVPGYRA